MLKLKKVQSYSDFTLDHLQVMFGLKNGKRALNLANQMITPSQWLNDALEKSQLVRLNSEKAKSEWVIAPILLELASYNINKFNIFSGNTFDVDPSQALKGRCDFILTKNLSLTITTPIIAIFEAKDDSLERWLGQCGAEMYAARLFNQTSHESMEIIYGAVTNGNEWLFLRLEGDMLWVDTVQYSYRNLPELLGVLQTVIDFYC